MKEIILVILVITLLTIWILTFPLIHILPVQYVAVGFILAIPIGILLAEVL